MLFLAVFLCVLLFAFVTAADDRRRTRDRLELERQRLASRARHPTTSGNVRVIRRDAFYDWSRDA